MIKSIYHYIIITKSKLFDRAYYLQKYPDVLQADIDSLWHYIRIGWKEGRNPSKSFNTNYYLDENTDVKQANINPLVHYIKLGQKEGRSPKPGLQPGTGIYHFDPVINKSESEIPIFDNEYIQRHPRKLDEDLVFEKIKIYGSNINMREKLVNNSESFKHYDTKVSIIIPTINAGDDFDFLIKMLLNQKGFREIEIVIVDSGSSDHTLEIANRYRAKIIEIPNEEFSHSHARNLGAKNASGEYLLFTVQDALPPSPTWLNELVTALKAKDVSAVSCAELPREDADLFYRVISWNHYEFLDVNKHDRILSMPSEPNHFNLRKNGQLSDLACLIPAELFRKYQYRFSYAEDLDLGIRLIKDGLKIAFLGSTRIIHSHNRPAYYFLKRGYVDNIFLSDIFEDFKIPQVKLLNVIEDISFSYNFLIHQVFTKIRELNYPIQLSTLHMEIRQSLDKAKTFSYPIKSSYQENAHLDPDLSCFIDMVINKSGYNQGKGNYEGKLIEALSGFVNITFEYLKTTHDIIDKPLIEELTECFIKEISILAGAHLAYAFINRSDEDKELAAFLHSILKANV
jgi:glycosyltransferase involved in cell wall biosynthesis